MQAIYINCADRKKHKDEVRDALSTLKTSIKKDGLMTAIRDREGFRTKAERTRTKRQRAAIQRRKDARQTGKQR